MPAFSPEVRHLRCRCPDHLVHRPVLYHFVHRRQFVVAVAVTVAAAVVVDVADFDDADASPTVALTLPQPAVVERGQSF